MTRENKVGMVVAASFLCLVGIVLASRLRQQDPDTQEVAKSDALDSAKLAITDVVPKSGKSAAAGKGHKTVPVKNPPALKKAPNDLVLVRGPKNGKNSKPPLNGSGKTDGKAGDSDGTGLNGKDDKNGKDGEPPPDGLIGDNDGAGKDDKKKKDDVQFKPVPVGGAGKGDDQNDDKSKTDTAPGNPKKDDDEFNKILAKQAKGDKGDKKNSKDGKGDSDGDGDGDGDGTVIIDGGTKKDDKKNDGGSPSVDVLIGDPKGGAGKTKSGANGDKKPAPVLNSSQPGKKIGAIPIPVPSGPGKSQSTGKGEPPPIPAGPTGDEGEGEDPNVIPPAGSQPKVKSPSIKVPATTDGSTGNNNIVTRVRSYAVEAYTLKQGDNFATICQDKYGSDKLAEALREFNRTYYLAAPDLKRNPPVLETGRRVYVPEVSVLEEKYASLIPGHKPVDRKPATILANPQPVGDSGRKDRKPNRTIGKAVGVPTDQSSGRTYRVQGTGVRLWNIARHSLGNPQRWQEIYRLNPQIAPEYPIPAGTVLRMPADAKTNS